MVGEAESFSLPPLAALLPGGDNEGDFFSDPAALWDLLSVVVVAVDGDADVVVVVVVVVVEGLLSAVEDVALLSPAVVVVVGEPRALGLESIFPASADTSDPFFSVLALLPAPDEALPAEAFDAFSSKNLLATSLALEDARNDLPLEVVVVVVLLVVLLVVVEDDDDEDDNDEDILE